MGNRDFRNLSQLFGGFFGFFFGTVILTPRIGIIFEIRYNNIIIINRLNSVLNIIYTIDRDELIEI